MAWELSFPMGSIVVISLLLGILSKVLVIFLGFMVYLAMDILFAHRNVITTKYHLLLPNQDEDAEAELTGEQQWQKRGYDNNYKYDQNDRNHGW